MMPVNCTLLFFYLFIVHTPPHSYLPRPPRMIGHFLGVLIGTMVLPLGAFCHVGLMLQFSKFRLLSPGIRIAVLLLSCGLLAAGAQYSYAHWSYTLLDCGIVFCAFSVAEDNISPSGYPQFFGTLVFIVAVSFIGFQLLLIARIFCAEIRGGYGSQSCFASLLRRLEDSTAWHSDFTAGYSAVPDDGEVSKSISGGDWVATEFDLKRVQMRATKRRIAVGLFFFLVLPLLFIACAVLPNSYYHLYLPALRKYSSFPSIHR